MEKMNEMYLNNFDKDNKNRSPACNTAFGAMAEIVVSLSLGFLTKSTSNLKFILLNQPLRQA